MCPVLAHCTRVQFPKVAEWPPTKLLDVQTASAPQKSYYDLFVFNTPN